MPKPAYWAILVMISGLDGHKDRYRLLVIPRDAWIVFLRNDWIIIPFSGVLVL